MKLFSVTVERDGPTEGQSTRIDRLRYFYAADSLEAVYVVANDNRMDPEDRVVAIVEEAGLVTVIPSPDPASGKQP